MLTPDAFRDLVGEAVDASIERHAEDIADRIQDRLERVLSLRHRNDDIALLVLHIGQADGATATQVERASRRRTAGGV
jgi:hypothetical protein